MFCTADSQVAIRDMQIFVSSHKFSDTVRQKINIAGWRDIAIPATRYFLCASGFFPSIKLDKTKMSPKYGDPPHYAASVVTISKNYLR